MNISFWRVVILSTIFSVAGFFLALCTEEEPAGAQEVPLVEPYTLIGHKWNHLSITYSCGSDMLKQAATMWFDLSGLRDGGCTDSNPNIQLILPDEWPDGPNVLGTAGWAVSTPGTIDKCYIRIAPKAREILGVYVHEFGHCIGSGHSEHPDANMAPYCCNPISQDDIDMVRFLYGPPEVVIYKLHVNVARD